MATGVAASALRLPGIYGPGRSAFERIRAGDARRIIKPGQVFNRIHVDDIAGAVAHLIGAAGKSPPPIAVNITDDLPAPPEDVIAHAAGLLGVAPPPEVAFEMADLSEMARSFYSENKRVSNKLLCKGLGYRLKYPTYREGLAAILRAS
jgi:nucleoside-diphosphate-sugar epimerase